MPKPTLELFADSKRVLLRVYHPSFPAYGNVNFIDLDLSDLAEVLTDVGHPTADDLQRVIDAATDAATNA